MTIIIHSRFGQYNLPYTLILAGILNCTSLLLWLVFVWTGLTCFMLLKCICLHPCLLHGIQLLQLLQPLVAPSVPKCPLLLALPQVLWSVSAERILHQYTVLQCYRLLDLRSSTFRSADLQRGGGGGQDAHTCTCTYSHSTRSRVRNVCCLSLIYTCAWVGRSVASHRQHLRLTLFTGDFQSKFHTILAQL